MSCSIDSLSSLIPGITIAFPQCHALFSSLIPGHSWHHDRLPSMSCSIGSLSSLIPGITIAFPQCHALLAVSLSDSSHLIPGHHDRLPSMSCSIGSLSSLIPGITIAFPQCHALLAVSPLIPGITIANVMLYWQSLLSDSFRDSMSLPDSWHHDRLPSMSCSIGSLSSLIPGITIAFPQCHALLAVSPL